MSETAIVPMRKASLISVMAAENQMDPDKFAATIRKTCMPESASNEDFAAFLMVAHKHGLNPVTREIYAFPKKGGGIQPIVGIDGWMTLINSHPNFDGMEFEDHFDKSGALKGITCRLFRKDRQRPVAVTEYMEECRRPTEPWTKWPARMLRHKAAIQAARYAFSFSGIIDQDEAERSPEVITTAVIAPPPPPHIEAVAPVAAPEPEGINFDQELDKLTLQLADAYSITDLDALENVWTTRTESEDWPDDKLEAIYAAFGDRRLELFNKDIAG
jgi:phage recombination protein Bet